MSRFSISPNPRPNSKRRRINHQGNYQLAITKDDEASKHVIENYGLPSIISSADAPPITAMLSTKKPLVDLTKSDHIQQIISTSRQPNEELKTVPTQRNHAHQQVCFGMIHTECRSTKEIFESLQHQSKESTYIEFECARSPENRDYLQLLLPTKSDIGTIAVESSNVFLGLLQRSLVEIQVVSPLPLKTISGKKRSRHVNFSICINVYGKRAIAFDCGKYLSINSLFLQHPTFPRPGLPYVNPHLFMSLEILTEQTETGGVMVAEDLDPKDVEMEDAQIHTSQTCMNILNDIVHAEDLEEKDADGRVFTPLMRHQKQALYFFTTREQGLSIIASPNYQDDVISKTRGGILADAMGLGKTLSILSLVVSTLDSCRAWMSHSHSPIDTTRCSTLIITPLSTIENWASQITLHTTQGHLKYCVYHGSNSKKTSVELSDYDVIITTFSVVRERSKSPQDPLRQAHFFRIVVDEAHEIRGAKTICFNAICTIKADRRWAVTATPIQNKLEDLGALFQFLKCKPLDTLDGFQRHILWEQEGSRNGMENLRDALRKICLRRTKETINIRLPKRTENTRFVTLSPTERSMYQDERRLDTIPGQQKNPLTCILRLRMICSFGKEAICQNTSIPEVKQQCITCGQLTVQKLGAEEIGCPHRVLCKRCIDLVVDLQLQQETCDESALKDSPSPRSIIQPKLFDQQARPQDHQGPSTKISALLNNIKKELKIFDHGHSVSPKHVVFSQWIRMLDLISYALDDEKLKYCRLDGSMTRERRCTELQTFENDSECHVLLISLKAGGVGLNLTFASRAHLMEPHWNPMIELQALDRLHRIGQRNDVEITRYVAKDTIEMDMLNCQQKKIELARQSLDAGCLQTEKCDIRKEIIAQYISSST